MATRRKKAASADEADVTAHNPEEGAPVEEPKPKKKRAAPRKKKVEAHDDVSPVGVVIPLQPHPELPAAPKPMPVPPINVMPTGITIEPGPISDDLDDVRIPLAPKTASIPVAEDKGSEMLWRPPSKGDKDLTVPPRVLQAPRKYPIADVEDILEEPHQEHGKAIAAHDFVRPPVKAGLFRKIGIGFALVALAVLLFVGYVTYAHATVIVHPKLVEVKTDHVVAVAAEPADGEVGGQILEISVAGEKSGAPGVVVAPTAPSTLPTDAPAASDTATYVGTVTLTNKTSGTVTLVPTTRLLSSDGVLFRMKDRATVPAGGTTKVSVYADKSGKTGAIGPSKFTIPGLPADKQLVVYGQSDAAMVPEGSASAPPSTPIAAPTSSAPEVKAEDITAIENALHDELVAQAKDQLKKDETGTWNGRAYLIETMSRFVNVAPGEHADSVTVRLTLRVREVRYDRDAAINAATADLKRGLTSDRELSGVKSSGEDLVEEADPKAGKASVKLSLVGDSTISIDSPLFDAEKLKGLKIGDVQAYFSTVEGIDSVDVTFVPPWPRRMPDLKDHITFRIE